MNRLLSVLGGCVAVLLAAACIPPHRLTVSHSAAMRDSVSSLLTDFERYSANAQWDSLGSLYADSPEFVFLESGEIRYRTASAVREALRGVPTGTRIETRYEELAILPLAPGVAAVSGRFATRFINADGAQFEFGGVLSLVVQHEDAGWRIVAGHSSAPVPRGS